MGRLVSTYSFLNFCHDLEDNPEAQNKSQDTAKAVTLQLTIQAQVINVQSKAQRAEDRPPKKPTAKKTSTLDEDAPLVRYAIQTNACREPSGGIRSPRSSVAGG